LDLLRSQQRRQAKAKSGLQCCSDHDGSSFQLRASQGGPWIIADCARRRAIASEGV
jgi:hypothetical protein